MSTILTIYCNWWWSFSLVIVLAVKTDFAQTKHLTIEWNVLQSNVNCAGERATMWQNMSAQVSCEYGTKCSTNVSFVPASVIDQNLNVLDTSRFWICCHHAWMNTQGRWSGERFEEFRGHVWLPAKQRPEPTANNSYSTIQNCALALTTCNNKIICMFW